MERWMELNKWQSSMKTCFVKDLTLDSGWRYIFQKGHDLKHTVKSTTEWLISKHIFVLELPGQNQNLNPYENLYVNLNNFFTQYIYQK